MYLLFYFYFLHCINRNTPLAVTYASLEEYQLGAQNAIFNSPQGLHFCQVLLLVFLASLSQTVPIHLEFGGNFGLGPKTLCVHLVLALFGLFLPIWTTSAAADLHITCIYPMVYPSLKNFVSGPTKHFERCGVYAFFRFWHLASFSQTTGPIQTKPDSDQSWKKHKSLGMSTREPKFLQTCMLVGVQSHIRFTLVLVYLLVDSIKK